MLFELKMVSAIALDQIFGDPAWLPHPVKGIGWCCERCEKFFRNLVSSNRMAGFLTVVSILFVTSVVVILVVHAAAAVSVFLEDVIAVLLLATSLAAKDLVVHSRRVYDFLRPVEYLDSARKSVAMIVGRDTENLDRNGICRACVETVSENMVDGVTAPLFWAICFSSLPVHFGLDAIGLAAMGAMVYKAVNTMDSMFGYKNERYLEFGWAAARLDDLANFLPARISGFMVIPAAWTLRLDWHGAAQIYFRDRLNHSSPNSAHTEAAVAGALGIRLGGDSSYFGTTVSKPTIGDPQRDIQPEHILDSERIMKVGSLLFLALMLIARRLYLEM